MRRMRDDPVDQLHAVDLWVIEDILGRLRVALLRVAAARPSAARPAGFHRHPLGGRQQLPPNAPQSVC
jgi:hypothetical protein